MQIRVCYDGTKYFTHHVITIVSYFFRLFHRIDNFICYNWEGTAALSAAEKDLTGVRQRNSHRAPPPRVLCFCMTRHTTSRVTFCHVKTKS